MDTLRRVTKEVYLDHGRYKEAVKWGEHVVAVCTQTLGLGHRETAMAIIGLAKAHMELGDFEQAGHYCREVLPIYEQVFGSKDDRTKEIEKYSYLGQELGSYRLVKCLGKGGFGNVYLGEYKQPSTQDGQDSQLPRQAAVKILQKGQRDPENLERFFTEAEVLSKLKRHPNIVRVMEYDPKSDPPFMVMEYARYGTLRDAYPERTLVSIDEVIEIVNQIADGLDYLHNQKHDYKGEEKSLMHLDLKPDNILLADGPDGKKKVLIADFGLVQDVHHPASQPLFGGGTEGYVAPERALYHIPRPASDQYALAVIAYELLSGNRPFFIAPLYGESPKSLQEKVQGMSQDIEKVLFKALRTKSADRYQSIKEFAEAFEQAYRESLQKESEEKRGFARRFWELMRRGGGSAEKQEVREQEQVAPMDRVPRGEGSSLQPDGGARANRHAELQRPDHVDNQTDVSRGMRAEDLARMSPDEQIEWCVRGGIVKAFGLDGDMTFITAINDILRNYRVNDGINRLCCAKEFKKEIMRIVRNKKEDPLVRKAGLDAIVHSKCAAEFIVDIMQIVIDRKEDHWVRKSGLEAIVHSGYMEVFKDYIMRIVVDKKEDFLVRKAVLEAIGHPERAEEFKKEIMRIVRNKKEDPSERKAVLEAISHPECVSEFKKEIIRIVKNKEEDPSERKAVLEAISHPECVSEFKKEIIRIVKNKEEDPSVRKAGLEAMFHAECVSEFKKEIMRIVENKKEPYQLRKTALEAIGYSECAAEFKNDIMQIVRNKEEHYQARNAVLETTVNLGWIAEFKNEIMQIVTDKEENYQTREAGLKAITRSGCSAEFKNEIMQIVRDKKDYHFGVSSRLPCVRAKFLIFDLRAYVVDGPDFKMHWDVRKAGLEAIGHSGCAAEFKNDIMQIIRDKEEDPSVRESCLEAIGHSGCIAEFKDDSVQIIRDKKE